MNNSQFEYTDDKIGKREVFMFVPSMVIGVGILTLPRTLASVSNFSSAWMAVLIAGGIFLMIGFVIVKLTTRFPNQGFYEYTSKIITKPLAFCLTFLFAVHFLLLTAFEVRGLSALGKQYILMRTPLEVFGLIFILVCAYALAGSRAAIFRLNMMFFPIVFFILMAILAFNIPYMEMINVQPMFKVTWKDLYKGVLESQFSYLGIEGLLFYLSLVKLKDLKDVGRMQMYGGFIVVFVYFIVFIGAISVFSIVGAKHNIYPTVELSKEVHIPGGIIERVDPLFFTIFLMTIFNTIVMMLDLSLMALQSIFKKLKKSIFIFIFLPIIYFISMLPIDQNEFFEFGKLISYPGAILAFIVPIVLLVIAQLRGVRDQ